MDIKQMILIEYLIDTTINSQIEENYDLLFTLNEELYTGHFLQFDTNQETISNRYVEKRKGIGGFDKRRDIFSSTDYNMKQKMRRVFSKNEGVSNIGDTKYLADRPHLFLERIVNFVSNIDPDRYLNDELRYPPIIYNLKNINTNKSLNFYLVSDEDVQPVSLIPRT